MPQQVLDLLNEYAIALENSELSPRTITTYKTSLNQFRKWLIETPDIPRNIGEIKPAHIERFFFYRKQQGTGKGTRQQNYIHINLFFKWVRKRYKKDLKKNPFKKVNRITYRLPITKYPERELLDKIIQSFDATTYEGIRNRFACSVLKDTGIRAQELLSLEEADFDVMELILNVRFGKGSKSRKVPFPETLVLELHNYLLIRAEQPYAYLPQLIITRQGGMAYSTLLEALTTQCELLDVDHISPHKFRHAFADYLKKANVTDEAVMEIMGWDTRTMLDHYARSQREVRAIEEYRQKIQRKEE